MDESLKLHGTWPSPFSYRVTWALKLKGIPYEHVEEDLINKSSLLLQLNPVYKKIPVLVHGGKPICESMIILQYIEEVWPQNPLLPKDPYDRSVARFWIKFAEDKGVAVWKIILHGIYSSSTSTSEELEEAKKESLEFLETVEKYGLEMKKYFNGEKIGMVDLVYGSIFYWLEVVEKVLGLKLLDSTKFPRICSWIDNFKQEPIIEDNLPDYDEMKAFYKRFLEMSKAST